MGPVRIAVQIHPQHTDYAGIRTAVMQAEDLSVDVVYNWDHFYPLYGGDPDPNVGRHFECWTMLGAWAEQTERIQFGALVTCNSYRNPELLADMARTVDHISNGRLILGIGSGWFEKDYDEYGYDFGTAASRLRDLDASMPRIVDRFEQLDPPPTRHIPILIGGGGEKVTLRIVAEHADVWHTFGNQDTIVHKSKVLDEWGAKVGRDAAAIDRSINVKPEQLAEADDFRALGVTEFTIGITGPDLDLDPVNPWLKWRDSLNGIR
jgi:probable F420-dependent oxidoreductase